MARSNEPKVALTSFPFDRRWATTWDCNRKEETLDRANPRCTSASKTTRICERCWCKVRTTFCPFGVDSDLRRWGLRLAERGGRNGKKRAIISLARKLAVLPRRLWVSAEVYEPLRNSHRMAMPTVV